VQPERVDGSALVLHMVSLEEVAVVHAAVVPVCVISGFWRENSVQSPMNALK